MDTASTTPDGARSSSGPLSPTKAKISKRDPMRHKSLACTNCRSKKIKCDYAPDGCQKCRKLDLTCVWPNEDQRKNPSSRGHLKELHDRIAELETALEGARALNHTPLEQQPGDSDSSAQDHNLISRLTERGWQLNSDAEGQYKFFGPTSSVHFTESISVSIFTSWEETSIAEDDFTVDDIDPDTQAHLLDLYWKYQHCVLQVFHKETFLSGHISKALLYCVYACAARISPRPEVRALVLPRNDEDFGEDLPYLLGKATRYTEEELKRPQITTIQALLLLSVVYCAIGRDTKGWLFTGMACRLVFDLGIHKDITEKASPVHSSRHVAQTRQLTFWACVVFDRLWALYLGRPYCLKIDDSTQQIMWKKVDDSWEARMAYAWVTLLEIVGDICDVLNADFLSHENLTRLEQKLQSWRNNLDASLRYEKGCPASMSSLHIQFCAAMILLHQPVAKFGSRSLESEDRSAHSRRQCIHFATTIASYLQDFQQQYGDATQLSGVALHSTALAATTLIAIIAERKSPDVSARMQSLRSCVLALAELETTYRVARRVRKIIQLIIRVCHLETEFVESQHRSASASSHPATLVGNSTIENEVAEHALPCDMEFPDETVLSEYSSFAFDESLLMSAQFDVFHTFDAVSIAGQDPFQRL